MSIETVERTTRDQRVDARVTREEKRLFERAASLAGRSVTSFLVQSSLDAAREIVQAHETIMLTARDRSAFVAALRRPPQPNEALQQAARDYAETVERRY